VVTPTERSLQLIDSIEIAVTKAILAAGNYAANDVISEHGSTGTVWTFAKATLGLGGYGRVVKATMIAETTLLTFIGALFLYNAAPTCVLNDNVANDGVKFADDAQFLGRIEFPALAPEVAGVAPVAEAKEQVAASNLPLPFMTGAALKDIYGVLVATDSETNETAGEDLTIKLVIERYG
jgi:hypothetical protein